MEFRTSNNYSTDAADSAHAPIMDVETLHTDLHDIHNWSQRTGCVLGTEQASSEGLTPNLTIDGFPSHQREPYFPKDVSESRREAKRHNDIRHLDRLPEDRIADDRQHEDKHRADKHREPVESREESKSPSENRSLEVRKSIEIKIPSDSVREVGELDPNFSLLKAGERFSSKNQVSVTTDGEKHWDLVKNNDGRTAYARIQEPLADGSGYRVIEYRSPFRDSQMLGSCYEVDKEGRVKESSVDTLKMDATLRLSRNNLSASVDAYGNLTCTIPGAGKIEDMSRTYYRNGTEMDSFVDGTRGAEKGMQVNAKYHTDENGQRESDSRINLKTGVEERRERPYLVVATPSNPTGEPINPSQKTAYLYDNLENVYYCTQGPEAGQKFDISVRNRMLIRNRR